MGVLPSHLSPSRNGDSSPHKGRGLKQELSPKAGGLRGAEACQAALSPSLGASDPSAWHAFFSKRSPKGPPSCLTIPLDSAAFNELLVSDTLVSGGGAAR